MSLLGGRVKYAQLEHGHRTGIEPVLLAACVPARPGELVLEAGTGAGAGLLCLAARVDGVRGVGVEREAELAALARANFAANRFDGLEAVQADLAVWRAEAVFDHGFANPPWHDPAGTASADGLRDGAKRRAPGLLGQWILCLARALRHRGTLSLALPAGVVPEALAGLAAAGCGSAAVFPLWARAGAPAKLVLLRGVRGGRGAFRLLPGLVLHRADGGFTEAADAVLRGAAALAL